MIEFEVEMQGVRCYSSDTCYTLSNVHIFQEGDTWSYRTYGTYTCMNGQECSVRPSRFEGFATYDDALQDVRFPMGPKTDNEMLLLDITEDIKRYGFSLALEDLLKV